MQSVSVVIPTYQYDNLPNLRAAVGSLKTQTVSPEIIVVVGGDIQLYKQAKLLSVDRVFLDPENGGATHARNIGAKEASGNIVAFLDDDEVADPKWCENLVSIYKLSSTGGAGGKNLPLWECPLPRFLPEEMYWLVGVTHRGFAPDNAICPIRNTFAGNMSFRRDVFEEIGGFDTKMGLSNGKLIQGEEPEICDRMRERTGLEYWYVSNAVIYNRVPATKTKMWRLLRRAYWQGYTKRLLAERGMSLSTENGYLGVVGSGIIHRLVNPSVKNWGQVVPLVGLTGATGMGYIIKVIQ